MVQNFYKLWVATLVLTGGIALWFAWGAAQGLWQFVRLDASTPATVAKLEILPLSSSRFAIKARYTYEIKGVSYFGETTFEHPQFLNRYAAENHVKLIGAKRFLAWYREKKPSFSSLEREFPKKNCLQALITVGVFAYFYFGRSMLARMLKG